MIGNGQTLNVPPLVAAVLRKSYSRFLRPKTLSDPIMSLGRVVMYVKNYVIFSF